MNTTQEFLGKILKNRINSDIAKNKLNVTEMQRTLDIFLASDKITNDQYIELTNLINPVVTE